MGVVSVRLNTGLFSVPYASGQDIIEERVPHRDKPYFFKTEKRPMEFELTFSTIDGGLTPARRHSLARWLIKDYYAELQFVGDMTKMYRVIAISDVEFVTNGNDEGYFSIQFRCDAPWAWSNLIVERYACMTGRTINISNKTNVAKYHYPEIEIRSIWSQNISFVNLREPNRIFSLTGIVTEERIYFDNENRRIITDLPATYRLKNFNRNWLRLMQGENTIRINEGMFLLTLRTRYPIAQ